jgi:hypothetical protein
MKKIQALVALAILLANASLFARPVREIPPEELFAKAEVVANGKVIDVVMTDRKSQIPLGANQPLKVKIAEARIRRIGVSKGDVSGEFKLLFPVFDPDNGPIVNGPILPCPTKNKRYRFYLKRQDSGFVTVLNEEFDSGFAVQPLAKDEPDDSSPLFKDEAEKIALAEFRKYRSEPASGSGHYCGLSDGTWSCEFSTGEPLSFPAFSYDAEIFVDGSRSISPKSWVGKEQPRKVRTLSKADLGKMVRLTVEGSFEAGVFKQGTGMITSLFGEIESADKGVIVGTFSRNDLLPGTGKSRIKFPAKSLASIQRLILSPREAQ